jgi:PAS domain S-box-containing protein
MGYDKRGTPLVLTPLDPFSTQPAVKRQLSLRTTLVGLMALLLLVEASAFALRLNDAWGEYRTAQRISALAALSDHLLRVSLHLEFERGWASVALIAREPIQDASRAFLTSHRHDGSSEFAAAMLLVPPELASAQQTTLDAIHRLDAQRAAVDQQALLPVSQRDATVATNWLENATAAINQVEDLQAAAVQRITDGGGDFARQSNLKLRALQIRNDSGLETTLMALQIERGGPADIALLQRLATLRGRIDANWQSLRQDADAVADPRLAAAIGALDRQLFVVLRPLEDRLLANDRERAGWRVADYLTTATLSMNAVMELGEAAIQRSTNLVAAHQDHARHMLWTISGQLALVLGLGLVAVLVVLRRVVYPLERLTAALRDLNQGRFDTALPFTRRRDEIGGVSRALRAFRDSVRGRRDLDEAAAAEHLRNNLILASTGEGICSVDAAGRIETLNPAGSQILGWSAAEALGQPLHDLVHHSRESGGLIAPEDCPLLHTLNDHQLRRVESEVFWHRNGTCFPVEYTIAPRMDGLVCRGAVVVFHDISARRNAEAARHQTETTLRLYKAMVDQACDPIQCIDPQAGFRNVVVNGAAAKHFGVTPTQLLDMGISDLDPNFDDATRIRVHEKLQRDGSMLLETLHRCGERGLVPVEVNVSPLNFDGREYWIATVRDMSERRAAEEVVDVLRRRLDFLVNASPSIIYACEPAGDFDASFCSEGISQFGYSPMEPLADKDWWVAHIHPDDRERVVVEYRSLPDAERLERTYRLRAADGAWRWVIDRISVVRDAQQQPVEFVGAITDITPLKLAEAQLAVARSKLEAVLDAIPDIMLQLDAEDRCVDYNVPDASVMTELPGDFLGATIEEVLPAAESATLKAQAAAVRRDGKLRSLEFDYAGPGPLRRLEIRLAPLAEKGLLAIIRDVTAQRRAERQARDQLSFLGTLIDTIPNGIFWRDTKGVFLGCNAMYGQMIGRKASDISGKTLRTIYPDESAAIFETADRELLDQGTAQFYESKVRNSAGKELPVLLSKAVFCDDDGRPAGIVGAMVDITERKRNEALLETINWLQTQFITASEQSLLFQGLLERLLTLSGSQVGVLTEVVPSEDGTAQVRIVALCDLRPEDTHNSAVSRQFESLYGVVMDNNAPMISNDPAHDPRAVAMPRDLPPLDCFLGIPFESGGQLVGLVGLANRAGGYDEATIAFLRPLTATCGAILGAHLSDLRRRAYERQLADTKTQLQTQATELARSNAELESFAYVASHDLRQPLRMVSSYVSLLERRYDAVLDDDGREFIAFARDGAQRMDRMIVDLLEYSRIGRLTRPMEPVALADAVAEAMLYLEITAEECHAHIVTEQPLPEIIGDRIELVRLFQNLVGNALKYRADDRTPEVTIHARRGDAEWIVSVRDNGIGIAAESFSRVFGIFQRLHGRERYDGTGIGLAVCKKIVEHHGGRIWLESTPGLGSEFFVAFPDDCLREAK